MNLIFTINRSQGIFLETDFSKSYIKHIKDILKIMDEFTHTEHPYSIHFHKDKDFYDGFAHQVQHNLNLILSEHNVFYIVKDYREGSW